MKNQIRQNCRSVCRLGRNLITLVGVAFSASILTTAHAQSLSPVFTNIWSVPAGTYYDLQTGAANTERGIAWNPMTGNVLLASRASSNHISVINGATGSEIGALIADGVGGAGTLALMLVCVADDGAIYACNLSGGSVSTLRIYRWDSEASGLINPAVIVFEQTGLFPRYGDTMAIRGAGTNTLIAMGSGASVSASTNFALFYPTNEFMTNWAIQEFPLAQSGLAVGEVGKGITFDGTNNAIYGKKDGSAVLHHIAFDRTAGTNGLIENITTDANFVGLKYLRTNGVKLISGIVAGSTTATNATTHRARVYDITTPTSPGIVLDVAMPQPNGANGNVIGASDMLPAGRTVMLEPNNGIIAFSLNLVSNLPPSIVSDPVSNTNVLQGGYITFKVSANGTAPLRYRWRFNVTNNVPGGTNSTLTLTNLQLSDAGSYSCVVSNVANSVTSAPAILGIVPSVLSAAVVPLWTKSIGDLFFIQNDNTCRGMAYDPATGHLIVVSRNPSNGVHVLDTATGAYIRSLDMSGVTAVGATFLVDMVGVADDGAIYVGNLDITGANYSIYRWGNDSSATVATVAFGPGDPGIGDRIGDTIAVRGSGPNTQIIASSRNLTTVIIFTTTDGLSFTPNVVDVAPEPAGFAGLGIAFGAGDTFWSKSSGFQFRHFFFDLANGTNMLLQTFAAGQTTSIFLGVDPVNDLVAGVSPDTGTQARALPHNIELYDVHAVVTGQATEPSLIDQDFFQTSNDNGNGTGDVAFDVAGGRLFALDTNDGLFAGKVVARLYSTNTPPNLKLVWTGPSALQSATAVTGSYSNVTGAVSGYTTGETNAATFFRLAR